MNSENEKTKEFLVKFAEAIDLEDVELTIKTKLDTKAKTIGSKVYGVIKELIILLIV